MERPAENVGLPYIFNQSFSLFISSKDMYCHVVLYCIFLVYPPLQRHLADVAPVTRVGQSAGHHIVGCNTQYNYYIFLLDFPYNKNLVQESYI